jgi:gamma-glutamyltranspeptidase / glutathione hydrolase
MTNSFTRRQFTQSVAATSLVGLTQSRQLLYGQEKATDSTANTNRRTAIGANVAATVHPIASQAAANMYKQGGNAIDAAIAAALCLGVVDGHNSGIGGGCLMLIRTQGGAIHAIDGRETASANASANMFVRDGKPVGELSQTGPLACAVPSQVAALKLAHEKLGSLKWESLFEPAIAAAENGYAIGAATHNAIASERENLQKFEASRTVLLKPDGSVPKIGEVLRQPDLAKTLHEIAMKGPAWFYRDGFAAAAVKYLEKQAGILSLADFANYKAIERTSVRTTYRNYQVIGFPTPSSGGIHIAQMLNMLNTFDVANIYAKSKGEYFHLLAECMKRAFADRAHWLGDSDFVNVPGFLVDPSYAKSLASSISFEKASTSVHHGTENPDNEKKHTTHLTTADALGNWVALTSTVNTTWGCKVMVPGTGVMLNNQMDDFSISPGIPNAFGLVGSEANAISPNKRPLSSMSPTIVLSKDGSPFLTCGAAGGPKIINATLQNIVRCIDLNESIDQAIASARIHQQWRPDVVVHESNLGGIRMPISDVKSTENDTTKHLEKMGHPLKVASSLAVAQGIQKTDRGLLAASDPRTDGHSIAVP